MRRLGAGALIAAVLTVGLSACFKNPPAPGGAPTSIIAAFWYLTYPEAATGHVSPSSQAGPYSSDSATVLSAEVQAMQYAGIQVAVVPWSGPGTNKESTRVPAALRAADGTNLRLVLRYEVEGTANPDIATLQAAFAYLASRYAADPNYLSLDGRPVVFVASGGTDTCSTLDRYASANVLSRFSVNFKVFAGYRTCANQPSSWHQYGPAAATDDQSPYSLTISPGYYAATEATPRLTRDLTRWHAQVQALKSSPAKWHLVTTLNGWTQGTAIEPAEGASPWGMQYLDELHAQLNPSDGDPPPPTTTPPTTTPPTTTPPTTTPPTSTPPTSTPPTTTPTGGGSFRFASWADSRGSTSGTVDSATLGAEAARLTPLNPAFTMFPGDMCESGPSTTCMNQWKTAVGTVLFPKTFLSRGNHDSSGLAVIQAANDPQAEATRIGATSFRRNGTPLTYSFDYQGSHFVMVDLPGGDVTTMTASDITWLGQDLTAADQRGVVNEFLFWHGPMYTATSTHALDPASLPKSLIAVINAHDRIKALFNGHEHVIAFSRLDGSRIPGLTHPFVQVIDGTAGAPHYTCNGHAQDSCANYDAFVTIDVNGANLTVRFWDTKGTNTFTRVL